MKLGRAHTGRLPLSSVRCSVSKAATECNRRVAELQKLAAALASGSDEALELAAAAGDVEAQAEEDGVRRRASGGSRRRPLRRPEPLMVPAPSRSDSTTEAPTALTPSCRPSQRNSRTALGSVSDLAADERLSIHRRLSFLP